MIYKNLTIFLSSIILLSACAIPLSNVIPIAAYPFPNRKLPYKASKEKSEIILSKIDKLERLMSYNKVLSILGKPDTVTDIRKSFYGLSPKEDDFFMKYRRLVSYRAIWYLSKENRGANLSDKWISIYLEPDEKTVFYVLKNNID